MDMSEVLKLDAPVKITKLSQAIRIGAKLRPQCTNGQYFDGGATCALGAAYEAMRGFPSNQVCEDRTFLVTTRDAVHEFHCVFGITLTKANDRFLTREQIADQLEAIGY